MGESKNGLAGLKDLNWPTVVLLIVTGAGNWWSTQQNGAANRQEIDQNRAAIEKARSQVNAMFENQQRIPELEPVIETNAEHIHALAERIQELEKRVDNGMEALQHIVGESKDAASRAADISEETRERVKNAPPTIKHTTVVRKTQKINRIQRVQKVYKLF